MTKRHELTPAAPWVELTVDQDELVARLLNRAQTEGRADDTEEACVARLKKYHSETAPIVPFYESKGLVRRVDGNAAPDVVTERIKSVLSS